MTQQAEGRPCTQYNTIHYNISPTHSANHGECYFDLDTRQRHTAGDDGQLRGDLVKATQEGEEAATRHCSHCDADTMRLRDDNSASTTTTTATIATLYTHAPLPQQCTHNATLPIVDKNSGLA